MLRSLALFALLCAPAAIAQQPDKPAPVKASLVSEVSAAAPGKPFRVAVKLEHGPAYHTYGKTLAPDVVGKPTALTWELPPGWKMDELEWPATHKVPSTDGKDPAFIVDVYSTQLDFAQGIVRVDIAVRPVRAVDYIYATIRVKN